jgi:hypothetical protein
MQMSSAPSEYGGRAEWSRPLLIGAAVARLVRDGLRSQIATTSQWIAEAQSLRGGGEHPKRFQAPLEDQDSLRALMDVLGWQEPDDSMAEGIEIDLSTHGWALSEALQDQITTHTEQLRDTQIETERETEITTALTELTALSVSVLLKTTSQRLLQTPDQSTTDI